MALEPFQLVVERHARDVRRFCASQVGVDRADDCFQDRLAVAYRVVGDLSDRDIGALMDTSEEAARRNVHEALMRLRGDLTNPARSTFSRA